MHRDIKPENVMVTAIPERPYVLLDLGIAFIVGGTALTADFAPPPGTPCYLAPEMLDPDFRKSIDSRADVYGVGLTIYDYATGAHPVVRQALSDRGTLPPLGTMRPDLPVRFSGLIDQMLKTRPSLRPSIRALVKAMEEWR